MDETTSSQSMSLLRSLYSLTFQELPLVVLDLETTGLRPHLDTICEVGALRVQGGQCLDTFHSLVNPQRQMTEEVVQIHNLTNEFLKDAPLFEEILPSLLDFIGGSVLVGHNAGFDISFLAPSALKWGVDLYRFPVIDTAHLARKLLPRQTSYSLSQLAQKLQLPPARFHRALDDATTTHHLLQALLKKAAGEGIHTLARLEERYPSPSLSRPYYELTPLERSLWKAITHGLDMDIRYRNRKHECTLRCITPERLAPPFIYAHCHLRQEQRVFLLNRIEDYKLLHPSQNPDLPDASRNHPNKML